MNTGRGYYVYMMQSPSRRALYIGVTSNLAKRANEHKQHLLKGFSATYNTSRLVYFERFSDIRSAIDRETQLKHWRRSKKEWLIQQMNSSWKGLGRGLGTAVSTHSTENIGWLDSARHDSLSYAGIFLPGKRASSMQLCSTAAKSPR